MNSSKLDSSRTDENGTSGRCRIVSLLLAALGEKLNGTIHLSDDSGILAEITFEDGCVSHLDTPRIEEQFWRVVAKFLPSEQVTFASSHAASRNLKALPSLQRLVLLPTNELQEVQSEGVTHELGRLCREETNTEYQYQVDTTRRRPNNTLGRVEPLALISECVLRGKDLAHFERWFNDSSQQGLVLKGRLANAAYRSSSSIEKIATALRKKPESYESLSLLKLMDQGRLVAALGTLIATASAGSIGRELAATSPTLPATKTGSARTRRRSIEAPLPPTLAEEPALLAEEPALPAPPTFSTEEGAISSDRTPSRAPTILLRKTGSAAAAAQKLRRLSTALSSAAGGAPPSERQNAPSLPPDSSPHRPFSRNSDALTSNRARTEDSRRRASASSGVRRMDTGAPLVAPTGKTTHQEAPPSRRSGAPENEPQAEANSLKAWMSAEAELRHQPRALAYTKRAAQHYPENPAILFYLGSIQAMVGDVLDAQDTLTRVVELDPEHSQAERELRRLKLLQDGKKPSSSRRRFGA